MTTYQINDYFHELVRMKLTIDWSHPDADAGIREMSMFWFGNPAAAAPIEKHLEFFIEVMAARAYELSRENKLSFNKDKIHELVFDAEGFCGSSQPWIKMWDFIDETAEFGWEIKKLEEGNE